MDTYLTVCRKRAAAPEAATRKLLSAPPVFGGRGVRVVSELIRLCRLDARVCISILVFEKRDRESHGLLCQHTARETETNGREQGLRPEAIPRRSPQQQRTRPQHAAFPAADDAPVGHDATSTTAAADVGAHAPPTAAFGPVQPAGRTVHTVWPHGRRAHDALRGRSPHLRRSLQLQRQNGRGPQFYQR